MVSAIADRIIPRTDTPGAADVGVPAFIDLLYGQFMTEAERKMLTDGLDRSRGRGQGRAWCAVRYSHRRASGCRAAEYRQG